MMGSLRDIAEQARRSSRLPEIAGERCVHALVETARCRACVQACPRGAWILNDETLGLDTEACDGCGLCAPACPEGAIVHGYGFAVGRWEAERQAMCACTETEIESSQGLVPCIHGFGLRDLLELHGQGVRRLVIASGDCDRCPRGKAKRLPDTVSEINRSLQSEGLDGFTLVRPTVESWRGLLMQMGRHTEAQDPISRRGFFKNLTSAKLPKIAHRNATVERERLNSIPPGRLFPARSPGALWPFVPVLQAELCRGCDACVRLCPHQAIMLGEVDGQECYELFPENCTGCGICVDLCTQGAVSLTNWSSRNGRRVPLKRSTCKTCGAPFHIPVAARSACSAQCPICAEINHYTNLYQVMD